MTCSWKENWDETRAHFEAWWQHRGPLIGAWNAPLSGTAIASEPEAVSLAQSYTDAAWRARWNEWNLARRCFPGDILPVADADIGPGSLALYLGSQPTFSPDTVWFNPLEDDPRVDAPLRFDPQNFWCRTSEATLLAHRQHSAGHYLAACPDLVENLDILASLRGVEPLLGDLIDRPGWVEEKLADIHTAWLAVYERVYQIIRLPDGSSTFGAFRLWGPGRTAKIQCDFSALISPRMFRRFVLPWLAAQCNWLDHSMFHLDGHQCLCHLDLLLSIPTLDAIEWTPDPTVPSGGDPEWYPLYRKILAAGKSVQAVGVKPHEVLPLLDAVGGAGMYLMIDHEDAAGYETIYQQAEPYRA